MLINTHTYPDTATLEINHLPKVVEDAKSMYKGEDDFMVLGDLNADCSYFNENSQSTFNKSDYYWVIDNSFDTTVKSNNCTYDRIIITTPTINDYTGNSGVFKIDEEYNLDYHRTIAFSDHYPVYANFYLDKV